MWKRQLLFRIQGKSVQLVVFTADMVEADAGQARDLRIWQLGAFHSRQDLQKIIIPRRMVAPLRLHHQKFLIIKEGLAQQLGELIDQRHQINLDEVRIDQRRVLHRREVVVRDHQGRICHTF